jgi:hypothetical protein
MRWARNVARLEILVVKPEGKRRNGHICEDNIKMDLK